MRIALSARARGQGAVTAATMAAPLAVSLLLLARRAAQEAMRWAALAAARLRAAERLELLGAGLAPSLPPACMRARGPPPRTPPFPSAPAPPRSKGRRGARRRTCWPWSAAASRSCRRSRRSCAPRSPRPATRRPPGRAPGARVVPLTRGRALRVRCHRMRLGPRAGRQRRASRWPAGLGRRPARPTRSTCWGWRLRRATSTRLARCPCTGRSRRSWALRCRACPSSRPWRRPTRPATRRRRRAVVRLRPMPACLVDWTGAPVTPAALCPAEAEEEAARGAGGRRGRPVRRRRPAGLPGRACLKRCGRAKVLPVSVVAMLSAQR